MFLSESKEFANKASFPSHVFKKNKFALANEQQTKIEFASTCEASTALLLNVILLELYGAYKLLVRPSSLVAVDGRCRMS